MHRWSQVFFVILWYLLGAPCAAQEGTPVPACSMCEAKTIACPTCAGAGVCTVECAFCGGDGVRECLTCDGDKPGYIDCPNRFCREGKTQWEGGDSDPCKLCAAKGRIQCPSCRGRKAGRCGFCAGTGKRARTCWTCAGAKVIGCPACTVDPARTGCGTCKGTARVACRLCEEAVAKGTSDCARCYGDGTIACATCRGLDRTACTKCAATGKMRLGSNKLRLPGAPLEKAGVKQCELCEGRAVKDCVDCVRGRLDCVECERGQVPKGCTACLRQRSIPCDECLSGGHARAETLGVLLMEKGFAARAVAFFEAAMKSARTMQGPRNLPVEHAQLCSMVTELTRARELLSKLHAAQGDETKGDKAERPAAAPALPAAVEIAWPLDLRTRHWQNPPAQNPLDPWTHGLWLATHRASLVTRLEAALARARSAAGK